MQIKRLFLLFFLVVLFQGSLSGPANEPEFRALVDDIRSYNATVYFRDPRVAILIARYPEGEYERLFAKLSRIAGSDQDVIQLLKETLWALENAEYLEAWDRFWRWDPIGKDELIKIY